MTGLTRDGHLTDLALECALVGDASPEAAAHLAECAECQRRLEAARAVELPEMPAFASFTAPTAGAEPAAPPTTLEPAPPLPQSANRPWMWALLAIAAAAIAIATVPLLTASETTEDGYRVKGSGISLQVFRDGGKRSERLRSGDLISPGDRLGFRIRNRASGHLLVFGVDAADNDYLCYPQGRNGASIEMDSAMEPIALPEAIRMDDTPGVERLVALICDDPFHIDDVLEDVRADRTPAGCALDDVFLEKP